MAFYMPFSNRVVPFSDRVMPFFNAEVPRVVPPNNGVARVQLGLPHYPIEKPLPYLINK